MKRVRLDQLAFGGIIVVMLGLNLALAAGTQLPMMDQPYDWHYFQFVADAAARGQDVYGVLQPDSTLPWLRWSPIAAYLMIPVFAAGIWVWRAVDVATVFALRDWKMIAITLTCLPFWLDLRLGNIVTICFVAAALAVRGGKIATPLYLGLCLLVPRPLMAPVAVWLLWKRPEWRIPFLVAALAEIAAVAAMGYLPDWWHVLTSSTGEIGNSVNLAPSRLIGEAWMLAGLPLAAWLTWRGRLGLASLAASPYWLPYYLLFGLLEMVPTRSLPTADREPGSTTFAPVARSPADG